jgi:hypothetical protein
MSVATLSTAPVRHSLCRLSARHLLTSILFSTRFFRLKGQRLRSENRLQRRQLSKASDIQGRCLFGTGVTEPRQIENLLAQLGKILSHLLDGANGDGQDVPLGRCTEI